MQSQSLPLVRTALTLSALLIGLSAGTAKAEFYVGIGAADELSDRAPSFGGRADADTVRNIFAGYNFTDTVGVEATYSDLGDLHLSGIADAGFDTDGDLWSVAVTYSPDTGAVRPYAKLGWFSRDENGQAITIAGPQRINFDDDGMTAEIGGRWFVNDSFALRLGYSWFDFDGGSDGSVGAGVEWHFN